VTGNEVRHDVAGHRFVAAVDGYEAYLSYREVDEHTVDFAHTFTPPELRGRGLAEKVVRAGLAWAEAEGKEVIPTCSYVSRLLERDREAGS